MLKEAINSVVLPGMDELITAITNMATKNSHVPMLSRTHGQVKTCVHIHFYISNILFICSKKILNLLKIVCAHFGEVTNNCLQFFVWFLFFIF